MALLKEVRIKHFQDDRCGWITLDDGRANFISPIVISCLEGTFKATDNYTGNELILLLEAFMPVLESIIIVTIFSGYSIKRISNFI